MQIPVKNSAGEVVQHLEVRDGLFNASINQALIHQVLVGQLANRRLGTANTKTRADVSGGGRKPRPQKHSGRSRQGSIRAPQWRHGGVVFGPHPRDFHQQLPKKMRRLALRGCLTAKLNEGSLVVLDAFALPEPKTKRMAEILQSLGINAPALLVTREPEPGVIQSARNLPRVRTLPAHTLNVVDLLTYRYLVMTVEAVRKAEELWASPDGQAKPAPAPAATSDEGGPDASP